MSFLRQSMPNPCERAMIIFNTINYLLPLTENFNRGPLVNCICLFHNRFAKTPQAVIKHLFAR